MVADLWRAYTYSMRGTRKTLILAAVAIVLVAGISTLIVIDPWIAAGLAPLLLAIAQIIKAIGGTGDQDDD